MKSIRNKTRGPIAVPLPRGKKLHLGLGKTGEITVEAASHPPLLKLVEAGQVELVDTAATHTGHASDGAKVHGSTPGHTHSAQPFRSGDR
jgi:hypothetical protein